MRLTHIIILFFTICLVIGIASGRRPVIWGSTQSAQR